MKEISLRILVAIFGVPLILFLIYRGGLYFFAFVVIVSLAGQWEMYTILKHKNTKPQRIAGLIAALAVLVLIQFGAGALIKILLALVFLYIFAAEMFYNRGSSNLNISSTLLGIFYPVLFLAALLYLRLHAADLFPGGEQSAPWFIIFIMISIWICDTFAYFFGKNFGRHKLFKRVSPNKSIEGAVAGVLGAVLVFFLARWTALLPVSASFALVAGLITGIIGQLGDLVESWFKRDAGIKDSSALLPGHGGMLDRFDSLLFVSPAFLIFYFIRLL